MSNNITKIKKKRQSKSLQEIENSLNIFKKKKI